MPQLAFSDFFFFTSTTFLSYIFFAFCIIGGIFPFIHYVLKLRAWYNQEFVTKTIFSLSIIPNIQINSNKNISKILVKYLNYFNSIKSNEIK